MKIIALLLLLVSSMIVHLPAQTGDVVEISWDANTETDLWAYSLYAGQETRTYYQKISGIKETKVDYFPGSTGTYYFVVTASDLSGNESGFSEEVMIEVKNASSGSGGGNPQDPPAPGDSTIIEWPHNQVIQYEIIAGQDEYGNRINVEIKAQWRQWASDYPGKWGKLTKNKDYTEIQADTLFTLEFIPEYLLEWRPTDDFNWLFRFQAVVTDTAGAVTDSSGWSEAPESIHIFQAQGKPMKPVVRLKGK